MEKKLLSEDCNRLVLESFNQPDVDHSEYYQNIIDEHFTTDENIIEKLKLAVNRWKEYYKTEVDKFTIGTNWNKKAKAWDIVAEKDRYTIEILLFEKWNIQRKVNLAFFENHLRIIEDIERQRNFKKLEIGSYILERIKTNIENLIDNRKPSTKGFQSSLTDLQIQTLFDLLKGSYIDKNTNPDHFKAIFKNELLPAGFIPIKRVKKFTNTLLGYFVSELFQKENQSDYWHIAENCFERAKNLKQSLNNTIQYNPGNKPKGYNEIDTILKTFTPPLQ
jgi:hypothetical protein